MALLVFMLLGFMALGVHPVAATLLAVGWTSISIRLISHHSH